MVYEVGEGDEGCGVVANAAVFAEQLGHTKGKEGVRGEWGGG